MAKYTTSQTTTGHRQVDVIEAGKPLLQSPEFDVKAGADLWALQDERDQRAIDKLSRDALEQAGLISRQPSVPRGIAVQLDRSALPELNPGHIQPVEITVTKY